MPATVCDGLWDAPASRHEAACASGSVATLAAMADLRSGNYDTALVVGVELEKTVPGDTATRHLGAAAWTGHEGADARFLWPYGTGDIDVSVALQDIDGDGHLDLIAGADVGIDRFGMAMLPVICFRCSKGTRQGNLGIANVFRGRPGMYSLAFISLNGSPVPSIITVDEDTDSLTLFPNDGTGDFGAPRGEAIGYSGGTANSPYGNFLVTDVNQDHLPDLLNIDVPKYSPGNYQLSTILNLGGGHFAPATLSSLYPDSLFVPGDFAAADFRNTGHPDVIVVGELADTTEGQPFLAYAKNNGNGTFAPATLVTPSTAQGIIGVGDFNRDGKLDFVTLNTLPSGSDVQTLNVFLGNGDGTFAPQPAVAWGSSDNRWPVSVYVGDFNRDGKLDVMVYLYLNVVPATTNDVYVFYGNGDGTFQAPLKIFSNSNPFTLVDLNHDGIPDLVTCKFELADYPLPTPASTSVMLGLPGGGFGPPTTYNPYSGYPILPDVNGTDLGGQGFCTVGDFNGDGNMDIGVTQAETLGFPRYIQFLSGNGDGTFTPTYNVYPFDKHYMPQQFYDLDGDSKADLLELDGFSSSFNFIPGSTAQAFQLETVTEPITGSTGSAQVSLNVPSGSDTVIALTSSDPGLQIPATVTIPPGSISQQFTYTVTSQANVHHIFRISATLGSEEENAYNFVRTRADLQRLKRDTESGRSAAVAAASIGVGHAAAAASGGTATIGASSSKKKYWIAGAAAVLMIAAAVGGFLWRRSGSNTKISSMAVLPFVNATSDANNEFLSDGLTEDLIGTLSQLPNMKVMARSTVFRFKGKEDDPSKVGQSLNVDAVLTGRITRRSDNVMITADLVNVSDGSEIWGGQYSRNMADVSTLQQEITNDIASKLRSRLTGEQQKEMAHGTTQNSEAYQFYLKGRNALHKRGADNINQSIALFKQAITADPAYAPAYAGLADAYNIAPSWTGMSEHEAYTLSLSTAHKALELDPQLADAHAALAAALVNNFEWAEAEKEFRRALELEPNNAQFHYAYAFLYLVAVGQMDAALGEFRNALLLDPLSGIINTNYGYTLSAAHRNDEAVQQFRKTLEMDPNFFTAHRKFAQTYATMGKWAEADQQYRAFAVSAGSKNLPPPSATAKGFAELYRANLRDLSKTGQVGDILWAMSYAAEGDREQAMAWLQKSAANHGSEFPYEIRDPLFDPLRSDSRYVGMMHDVGLPP